MLSPDKHADRSSAADSHIACPICAASMDAAGPSYSVNQLFEMWDQRFTEATVDEHSAQSGHTRLFRCAECEFEIFAPQIIGTPNFYIELQQAGQGAYYSDDKWDFGEGLRDVGQNSSIVELGCGPGVFLGRAGTRARRTVGQEYNRKALEAARAKGLEVYALGDDVSSLKGQFDIAFSFHVLEHVADPVAFVEEMLSWVKPGGKIAISVPDMDGPLKFLDPCASNMPPHHASRWRRRTFEALARRLKLKLERVEHEPLVAADQYYYSTYWVRQSWLARALPARALPMLQALTFKALDISFKLLARFHRQEMPGLRGQSLYVLMSKPGVS